MLKLRSLGSWRTTVLSCLLLSGLAKPTVLARKGADDSSVCSRLVEHIYHGHIVAVTPPDLNGLWTSRSCEVRPGPEYVLRKYRFHNNSHFEVKQFYYADSDCTKPVYALIARGTITTSQASWTVPGAWEADYQPSHIVLIPYTDAKAAELGSVLNLTCPGFTKGTFWKALERYELYNFVEYGDDHHVEGMVVLDHDCTDVLQVSLHELQLLRLELQRHHKGDRRWLYLGDIHTDVNMRSQYRSTSYQEPLAYIEEEGCSVCKKVAGADDNSPPVLHRRHRPPAKLQGEWFSWRCETRPRGMFLTRRLLFHDDNQTWEGYYYHYTDALCRQPSFTIYARGTYVIGELSTKVDNSQHFDFKVDQVKVTPDNKEVVYSLNNHKNGNTCGKLGSWRHGVEQDVTETNGCVPLGIKVPHVEYELIRFEKEHHKILLYIGQRPSDIDSPSSPDKRPTSFQPPLVRCGDARTKSLSESHNMFKKTIISHNSNPKLSYSLILFYTMIMLGLL